MKMRYFLLLKVCSNFERFKSTLETVQVPPSLYFRSIFLTVRPNAANDMALESLRKCEIFGMYCLSQFLTVLSQF